MSTVNDPNSYGLRIETAVVAGAIAALGGWVAGVQAVLHIYDGRGVGLLGLWRLIAAYGPLLHPWGWKGAIPVVTAAVAGLASAVGVWRFLTIPSERHVRGYILHRDPKVIARALRPDKGDAPGVHLHPQVAVSQRQETNHFMIVGGTGAGKTTVIWPMVQEAIARNDLVLIFDSKGDFTQKVGDPFTLLSPTDARSSRWVIGRDIRTKLEAGSLAETLIREPQGGSKSDPMWIQGSRALLTGLITDLQTRYGERWGFAHLASECSGTLASFERLKSMIMREAPMCVRLLGGEEAEASNRTTDGFLTQIVSSMTQVIHLGVSAQDLHDNPGWSVRSWLAGKTPSTVVVGFRGEQSKEMSRAWASSIIQRVALQVGGLKDAAPHERRIWLIVDEAPEAGRVPFITTSLTTLRSKGVRVVLGFQTLASVRVEYDKDTAQIWEGQCDLKIMGKLTAGADQEWGSRLLGDREVERYQHQLSQQSGSDQRGQHSSSWQRVREPILMPASFGQELGMQTDRKGRLKGPRALMLGGGQAAVLDWPLTPRTVLREPVVDARWIQPGYKAPAWGKTPPDIAAPSAAAVSDRPDEREKAKPKRRKQAAPAPLTPAPIGNDLPNLPVASAAEETISDHAAQEVAEHVLDMSLPGAGIAARILGIVAQAAPAAQTVPPLTPGLTAVGPQEEQERDDGREAEE